MKGYAAWAERYTAIFGLVTDADGCMVQAWESVFEASAITADELEAATDWLSQNSPSMNRPDHRPAILSFVRERRMRQYTALEKQREEAQPPACQDCGGTGWAIVPHLRSIRDGEWQGTFSSHGQQLTSCVVCSCPRGERLWQEVYGDPGKRAARETKQRPHPMRLADYEPHNPRWREQLQAKFAEDEATEFAQRSEDAAHQLAVLKGLVGRMPDWQYEGKA